ncbi:aldehyde dehydrogenase [Mycobacterium koreense]|uniref:Aldehyde dehydrogenase n=1 Tax=Mycolicibacillus koreensis TaxID=1069220 RepID=A0A7I7SF84_9MYCO|nr:aldehyde dehydrogenase family protein [Mycolicibacillus koreensis]MCV7250300.1 aldehyde dehydrogenase [Mycolicibacillus koreensis]OSC33602.1 aldehyde dehydrogenase [Mycolicibacillus koreensis]BBY54645.1 putative aldehyde dehydrogenase [Mycolicibacillus koreensis]
MLDPAVQHRIDQALDELGAGERAWAAQSLSGRRDLLDQVRRRTVEHGAAWIEAAGAIKGLAADSPLVGEEWLSGPYALAAAAGAYAESLAKLADGKSPLDGVDITTTPGGQTAVTVLPASVFDHLLLSGFSAQVWLQPGVDRDRAVAAAGLAQRDPGRTQGIGVVLGAGNIFSIAPLDTLYELIAHNRVVALKLNPITDPLRPVLTDVLAPLIDLGAVRILTGGADVGDYLVRHPSVSHVHMTGSAATHDAIVFGTGADGAERKAANRPQLTTPMTSELGGVSPTIVLPGQWSDADIDFQAQHVVTQRLHNNGYNCVAAQAIVVSARWPQREQFLTAVRRLLDAAPGRPAYYPGSDDRVASAQHHYPTSVRLGPDSGRVLITDPADRDALLQTEYFAPVLGVIELDSDGEQFAIEAARLANTDFVGTLGVNIIAHPHTIGELGTAFDTLVESLHYGTVAINAWTGVGYLTPHATWGAFPGHTPDDVQSGIGVVHNGFLIADPQRTVVHGPFRPSPRSLLAGEMSLSPKPPWFVTNRTAATTGRLLTEFAGDPGWLKLPGIFASALRG